VSKHFEFDSSSQAQAPTTPPGGLCEKTFESTNVVSLVVNMKSVKGLFFLLNTLDLGITILLVVSTTCGQWT